MTGETKIEGSVTKETAVKRVLRSVERFVTSQKTVRSTYVKGFWKPIKFHQLRKGFIFRLWDSDENGDQMPDRTVDGKHDVCVAVSDAYEHEDSYGIESLSIQGF